MADKNIGALPLAPQADNETLFVVEQQGEAKRIRAEQLKGYIQLGGMDMDAVVRAVLEALPNGNEVSY